MPIKFIAVIFFFMSSYASAQSLITPHSPFFGLTHELYNCKTLGEQRGFLNREDVAQKNVCILKVRCDSRPKLNHSLRGPIVTQEAYCFPNRGHVCPSAQFCVTDVRYFKPHYMKYVVKPKRK